MHLDCLHNRFFVKLCRITNLDKTLEIHVQFVYNREKPIIRGAEYDRQAEGRA